MAIDKGVNSAQLDNAMTATADAIRSLGNTSEAITWDAVIGFESAIRKMEEKEEKDVIFIDYDGRIVYSYDADEFLALESFPENPTHKGLISQGWNWELEDAQDFVRTNGGLIIGQLYITDDGATRFYCDITEDTLSLYIVFYLYGSVTINWGDNSQETTASSDGLIYIHHVYEETGRYVISMHIDGYAVVQNTPIVTDESIGTNTRKGMVGACIIKKVEFGDGFRLGSAGMRYCEQMRELVLCDDCINNSNDGPLLDNRYIKGIVSPKTKTHWVTGDGMSSNYGAKYTATTLGKRITSTGTYSPYVIVLIASNDLFDSKDAMRRALIVDGITSIGNNCFRYCYSLENLSLPSTLQTIGNSAFRSCYNFTNITIPESVTSIADMAFYDCQNLKEIHMKPTTPPSLGGTNVFYNTPSDMVIYVPQGSLSAYQQETNWSSYSAQMREEA